MGGPDTIPTAAPAGDDALRRQGWWVIFALFIDLVFVGGPNLTLLGVLFPPWLHEFHWTHGQVARMASATALTTGLLGPLAGWLVDRVSARWLMAAGLTLAGICDLAISHLHALNSMMLLFGVAGIGGALAGLIPMMVVAISWFKERRGIATGVVIAGLSTGMTISPPLITWLISLWGWRIVMRLLALPIFLIVIPMVLLLVRTRPLGASEAVASDGRRLPMTLAGLELGPALLTATFWLLLLGQVLYTIGFGGVYVHQITFMVGVGYTPEKAAWIFSSQTAASGLGALVLGALADRMGPKRMLVMAMVAHAIGVASLLATASPHLTALWIVSFAIFWGMSSGTGNLMPMLITETLGMRRLGTLMGVIGFCAALAGSFAPWISGRLFDRTGSYLLPFELAMLLMVLGAVFITTVYPAKGRDALPGAATPAMSSSDDALDGVA
jgi:MFS family permease